MDKVEVTLIVLLSVIAGTYWGTYRVGRMLERRALTAALVTAITDSYYEGYDDSMKQVFQRYKDGLKQGYANCLQDDFKIKDSY